MKDWTTIQTRYLQDELPVRLGGIAANLSRVKSFASHDANREVVISLIEESKFFIEWTAGKADLDVAAELIELQIQLSRWQHTWNKIWPDKVQRQQVASTSSRWSQRVLELSGLLD
jgi:hypothetical protein